MERNNMCACIFIESVSHWNTTASIASKSTICFVKKYMQNIHYSKKCP